MGQALLILTTIFLLSFCGQSAKTSDYSTQKFIDNSQKTTSQTWARKSQLPDSLTKITGDFNGDGQKDFAVVIPPYQNEDGLCEQCIAKVAFTNNIDSITVFYEANGAMLFNVGDLDGNKTDELLLIPDWFNSCLGTQIVYTYKSDKWDTIASGEIYRCSPRNTIEKIKNGQFTMTEYNATDTWVTKRKIK
jgi:hypothetical protein